MNHHHLRSGAGTLTILTGLSVLSGTFSAVAFAQDQDANSTDSTTTTEVISSEPIAFSTREVHDAILPEGVKFTVQEGHDGKKDTVKTSTASVAAGLARTSSEINTTISQAPTEKVVRVGTNKDSSVPGVDAVVAEKERLKKAENAAKERAERESRQKAAQQAVVSAQASSLTSGAGMSSGASPAPVGSVDVSASGVTTPEENRAFLASIVSGEELRCADAVVNKESGYQTQATNPSSGAYGVAQSLPASKYASHGADWRTNGKVQILWMKDYVDERYGGFCGALNFHHQNNWY